MSIAPASEFRRRLEALETWLWCDGLARLGLPVPTPELLAERVSALSDLYTLERDRLATASLRQGHLLARLLYFLVSDAPKLHLVLDELSRRGAGQALAARRIVDLGCGVGATTAGFLLSLSTSPARAPLHLTGVDRDPLALRAWTAVARQAAAIAGVDAVTLDPRSGDFDATDLDAETDLVLCQGLLNECLGPGEDHRHSDAVVQRLGGWAARRPVIVIEPALRIAARPLHDLKDRVLAGSRRPDGSARVRVCAPCPHQRACPMLASPRDWCHEIRHWTPTPRAAAIQAITRRRDDRSKFSFIVLAPLDWPSSGERGASAPIEAAATVDMVRPGAAAPGRLVSDALRSKGKVERVVCTAEGALRRLRLLDRERSPSNEALASLRRGELVVIDPLEAGDRIPRAAEVRRPSPPVDRSNVAGPPGQT